MVIRSGITGLHGYIVGNSAIGHFVPTLNITDKDVLYVYDLDCPSRKW